MGDETDAIVQIADTEMMAPQTGTEEQEKRVAQSKFALNCC